MANEFKVRKGLEVIGNASVTGDLSVAGNISGDQQLIGSLDISNDLHVADDVDIDSDLNVDGNATIVGNLSVTGSFSFAGGSTFPDNTFNVHDDIDATKIMKMDMGTATTGTTSTVRFSQTANRIIIMPDASTTLTGRDTTDTLTNKTLSALNNSITDLANANIAVAAGIQFNKMAAITASRVPVSDGSGFLVPSSVTSTELGFLSGVGSQVDGINDTRTLTNKTISAASNTITGLGNANIDSAAAIARSKLANGTASHVVINNGSGVMSSEAQLSALRGGTGADLSASTGVPFFTAGVASVSATLGETRGGTAQSTYATGDTLYASAANTLAKRTIGTVGQISKVNDSGIPIWDDWVNPSTELRLFDDWITDGTGQLRWLGTPVGTGANNLTGTSVSTAGHPGILELITGTTTTGQAARYLGGVATGSAIAGVFAAGGASSQEWLVRIEDLSDGTDRYTFDVGLFGAQTLAVDAIRFRYADNVSAGNWTVDTISASTSTTTDSGVAVAADTWYKLRIDINAAGSSITFYVNDVLVATHTTNIPSVLVAPRCRMLKALGTNSRQAYIDYFKMYKRFSSTR